MYEELSVGSAVVSTLATVVGTAVAVAQWRRNSTAGTIAAAETPPATAPIAPMPAAHRPPRRVRQAGRRPFRVSFWALVCATLACLLTAVSAVNYWLLLANDQHRSDDRDAAVGIPFVIAIVISGVGFVTALIGILVGPQPSRPGRVRLGLLAIVGCSAPWIYVSIMSGAL